jgi:ubiquitin carboxyl-terminal hydrolase 36/42
VHEIFGSHLRSQVKCSSCGYCSNKYESYLDLSLDIGKKANSLQKALHK